MRNQIKSFIAEKPDKQVEAGVLVQKVGTKYVTLLSLYGSWEYRITLAEFVARYNP